ncbi:hypothetical protein SY88_03150 [Clostridiales bacterium PH28_bin88]|nr:hypothetical protein SY88_03150 [Clostridiales bacterium PH28_bin88]
MVKTRKGQGDGSPRLPAVGIGVLYALGATLALSVIAGSLLHVTSLPETNLPTFSVIILLLSVFWGGTAASKTTGERGLVQGLAVGMSYFLITSIFTLALFRSHFTAGAVLQKALFSLLAGALGGVVGVTRGK